jgi:uncharacterized protein
VPEVIAEERRLSHSYGGRSVFGWEPAPEALPLEATSKQAVQTRINSTELPPNSGR